MVMPRHFLVKRQTPVDVAMNQNEFENGHPRPPSEPDSAGKAHFISITNGSTATCLVDPEQQIIQTEDLSGSYYNIPHHNHHLHHFHLGEYSSHGSPDSGYAASPNSVTREKDSSVMARECNNNNAFSSSNFSLKNNSNSCSSSRSNNSGIYNQFHMSHYPGNAEMLTTHHRYFKANLNTRDISSFGHIYGDQIYMASFDRSHNAHYEYEENVSEAPMDLSMPKKHNDSFSPPQQNPNQENGLATRPPSSPSPEEQAAIPAESAAVMYLNHLRGRGFPFPHAPSHSTYPHRMSHEITESETNSFRPTASYEIGQSYNERLPCITVPILSLPPSLSPITTQRTQPSRADTSSLAVQNTVIASPTNLSSFKKSPNRYHNSDADEVGFRKVEVPQENFTTRSATPTASVPVEDLSKSAPQIRSFITDIKENNNKAISTNLKNIQKNNTQIELNSASCNTGFSSSATATTPKSKPSTSADTSLAQGTKLATAPAAGKRSSSCSRPTGSTSSGRRLKAVRKLDFDVDTTSPVSGTIIKDAADFHPVSRMSKL